MRIAPNTKCQRVFVLDLCLVVLLFIFMHQKGIEKTTRQINKQIKNKNLTQLN